VPGSQQRTRQPGLTPARCHEARKPARGQGASKEPISHESSNELANKPGSQSGKDPVKGSKPAMNEGASIGAGIQ